MSITCTITMEINTSTQVKMRGFKDREVKVLAIVEDMIEDRSVVCTYKDDNGKSRLITYDKEGHFTPGKQSDFDLITEQKIRPYKDGKEFLEAMKEHGPYLHCKGSYFYPTVISVNYIIVVTLLERCCIHDYNKVLEAFTWQDGTECGIVE